MTAVIPNNVRVYFEVFEVSNWSIWSLKLKFLKFFNWSDWFLVPFHYFYKLAGLVGCLKMIIRLSRPQFRLKLTWVELRFSLAIIRFSIDFFSPNSISLTQSSPYVCKIIEQNHCFWPQVLDALNSLWNTICHDEMLIKQFAKNQFAISWF